MVNRSSYDYDLVHVASGDLWAGAEVQLYNLVKELHERGCRLRVVLFNAGELSRNLQAKGIDTWVISEKTNSFSQLVLKLRKLLSDKKTDIIHVHDYKESIVVSMASLQIKNVKVVRTVHGNPEHGFSLKDPRRSLINLAEVIAGRFFQHRLIAVSTQLSHQLQKYYPVRKIRLIENSIDVVQVEQDSQLPIESHYPEDKVKIAAIGRLVPLKRHSLLIDCMSRLLDEGFDNVMLYIYGNGPEFKRLDDKLKSAGLTKHVVLRGEMVPIYPHLLQMDLLIMPSDHEGLPMTLLEAMVLKVPVIAHATGGIIDLLGNGKYGELVTDHSVTGYTQAIKSLLSDSTRRKTIIASSYDHAKESYDIKSKVSRYNELYLEVLQ